MPKESLSHEQETLLRIIRLRALGASVKELLASPHLNLPKRTLQRRLDQLVHEGQLKPVGEGRARRYVANASEGYQEDFSEPTAVVREEEPSVAPGSSWLSPEGRRLSLEIRQPLVSRQPVGYQGSFLDVYQPNVTRYLSEPVRSELARIGEVGMMDLPAGTYLRQVMDRLLIDLSWNSSRLEGNTYSLLETQRLLERGENADGHDFRESQMILNHKAAIEMLSAEAADLEFNRYTICNLHALLSEELLPDPAAGGRLRSRPVGIGGSVFHPLAVPQQVEERFNVLLEKATAIRDPFEQAFFVMVQLPYLQPFEDVNKRVSRLAANIPLVKRNLCPLSFVDVDAADYTAGVLAVYELNRVELLRDVFVHAYRRSCARYSMVLQSIGDPDPFRMRHRNAIKAFVSEVVLTALDKKAAAKWIAERASREIMKTERARFVEIVETELSSLHEGNFARYRVRPAEFERWQDNWR